MILFVFRRINIRRLITLILITITFVRFRKIYTAVILSSLLTEQIHLSRGEPSHLFRRIDTSSTQRGCTTIGRSSSFYSFCCIHFCCPSHCSRAIGFLQTCLLAQFPITIFGQRSGKISVEKKKIMRCVLSFSQASVRVCVDLRAKIFRFLLTLSLIFFFFNFCCLSVASAKISEIGDARKEL